MRRLLAWLARAGDLFARARRDREFSDEIESHLQLHIDDNLRAGMAPSEARRQALLALGGVDQTKERYRDRRGSPFLDGFLQDVRYGLRALRRNPGFTAVAVGTLAVGIGATTAVFSLFNAVIVRSLPYGDVNRLVYIDVSNPRFAGLPSLPMALSNADFLDAQRDARSFASMAMLGWGAHTLTTGGNPTRLKATKVSGDFFRTLDVRALIGREIAPDDDRPDSERVAVISHSLWRSLFQGRADVLGHTITLDRQDYRIVGVMPVQFQYPRPTDLGQDIKGTTDVWVPLALTPAQRMERDLPDNDAVVARLRPGVSIAQAQAEIDTLVAQGDELRAKEWRGWHASVRSFIDSSFNGLQRSMWLLLAAISLVLLIACSNVAHLVLARTVGRAHEIGVRAALGATRGRIVRQILIEALLLSGVGGAVGIVFAAGAITFLPLFDPGNIPRLDQTSLDTLVLLLGVAVTVFAGAAVALFPAVALSRMNTHDLLARGGSVRATRASTRPREVLIVAEVALAFVLLTSASLLVRSYIKLQNVERGFSPSALTLRIVLDDHYGRPEQRRDFFRSVLSEVRRTAGVETAGGVSALPLSHTETVSLVTPEGHVGQKDQFLETRAVTGGYFAAMGTRLTAGRVLDDDDIEGRPVALVVNQAFASVYFHNESAIGKHVCLCVVTFGDGDVPSWPTIVGVVGNIRHSNLEDAPSPELFTSFYQGEPNDSLYLAIRTPLVPSALLPAVRDIVRARDPGLAVADVHVMDERVSEASANRRFQTSLLIVFAGIALVLAGVGLYGLLAYTARQRSPEFAIRMALGAGSEDILGLVLRQAVKLTAAGLAIGVVIALATSRLLTSLLYGVTPRDPIAFVVVPTMLTAVALLASWVPARRATRVDPLTALRME